MLHTLQEAWDFPHLLTVQVYMSYNKQLLDEVEQDTMNFQN